MRKQLMAGTALAAATMLVAGGAVAADKKMMKPSISVNGYYEGIVGGILEREVRRGAAMTTTVRCAQQRHPARLRGDGGRLEDAQRHHDLGEDENQEEHLGARSAKTDA